MEPKVKAAFDWLDDTHSDAEECWADYQKKLNRWHAHKAEFKAFLENFDAFKATVAPWVKKPEYVVDCMHKANAPTRYSKLNYYVEAKTAVASFLKKSRTALLQSPLNHSLLCCRRQFFHTLIRRSNLCRSGYLDKP